MKTLYKTALIIGLMASFSGISYAHADQRSEGDSRLDSELTLEQLPQLGQQTLDTSFMVEQARAKMSERGYVFKDKGVFVSESICGFAGCDAKFMVVERYSADGGRFTDSIIVQVYVPAHGSPSVELISDGN